MTPEEFDAYCRLPENYNKILEYVADDIIEKPIDFWPSVIAARILAFIGHQNHHLGHITGAKCGYVVNGDCYVPDVAFLSYKKETELPHHGYVPNPPDLAVEVISNPDNSQEQTNLRIKLSSYLAAGVVVWIVNPDEHIVEIHQAGKKPLNLKQDAIISGGDVLPDFELAVKDIFPAMPDAPSTEEA